MLKYYITVSFRQFMKTLNQFFYLSSEKEKFGNLYTGLTWATERIKAVLRYFNWVIFKQMDIISKMQDIMFAENYYM